MKNRNTKRNLVVAGAALGLLTIGGTVAFAADHAEAPGAAADPAADIADFYAWHTDDGKTVAILTVAGNSAPGGEGTYDADVLYGVHIDTDGDNEPDMDVWARFGQNDAGDWGVQLMNIPGGDETVVGAVETDIDAGNGLMAYAGVFDDPFFFDLEGYGATLDTGDLSFMNDRDSLAGQNATAIVIEMDTASIAESFTVWATTGRE